MTGEHNDAIKAINSYLEENPADIEAWLELADVYL